MVVARYFDLSAAAMRSLSPVTDEEIARLGEYAGLRTGDTVLDVACGKGEMLCQWAAQYGIAGVGVDISEVYVRSARARAGELGVSDLVRFEVGDAASFVKEESTRASYDVVSCLGGARYLGQLGPAVPKLRDCAKPDGLLVIGEPYWIQPPPQEAYQALGADADEYTTLADTVDRLQQRGLEVIDMIVHRAQAYDRVWAAQWRVMTEWLHDNPQDPDAPVFWQILDGTRRSYLVWGRDYFGFATFVCRLGRR